MLCTVYLIYLYRVLSLLLCVQCALPHVDMLVNTLCEQVKATPVGTLLHSINDDSEAVRLCGLYLKDFVAGVMQPKEQETQVCLMIKLDISYILYIL